MSGPRRLRPWLLEQLESGRFPGLEWDDGGRSALRIPWQHAGKGGAKGGSGTALCRAWAEFKGRLPPGSPPDPAGWKCRLRCALHRSPEFQELPARRRPHGPHGPYRVYRLLPGPTGSQPPKRGAPRGQQGGDAAPQPHSQEAPPPGPTEQPPAQGGEPTEATPPAQLSLSVESAEPLPPVQGPASLWLRLSLGGVASWQGWLPAGEYLLAPPPPSPAPGLVPRLQLQLTPPPRAGGPAPWAELGLLLASSRRGIFVRRRQGAGPVVVEGAGPAGEGAGPALSHAQGRGLREEELLQPFDAQSFRRGLRRFQAGLGPLPQSRVTLRLGTSGLVLELEQALARQLLDGSEGPSSCPTSCPTPVTHTSP